MLSRVIALYGGLLLSAPFALAGDDPNWCGAGFTNPNQGMVMPPEWIAQSVRYTDDIKEADLVVSFGQQTYPALRAVIEQYAEDRHLKVVVQSGTCGVSAGKLIRKNIDSGAFCCPPGKSDRLPGLEFHTVAISPIAVIVNRDNPIENISTAQARELFRGKLLNWQELNGNPAFDRPITTVARLHCTTRPGHWTLLLSSQELFGPKLKEVGVIPDLIAKVGQEAEAVSIETPFMVREYDKLQKVKMLRLDGHGVDDIDYIAAAKYPFYRTYSLTTWSADGKREPTLKLIRHLQDYIEQHHAEYGFVPVSRLRKAGWQFLGDELIAEPNGRPLAAVPVLR